MNPINTAHLTRVLMDEHGLGTWHFRWSNAKRVAGSCNLGTKTISLSKPLTINWTEDAVRNVILHEIAHALAPRGAGHGREWKRIAREIGCTGDRCWTPSEESPKVPATWVGVCPSGHTVGRYRLPKQRVSCSQCSRRFDERFVLVWERNLIAA